MTITFSKEHLQDGVEKIEGAFLEAEFNEKSVNPDKYLLTGKELIMMKFFLQNLIMQRKITK